MNYDNKIKQLNNDIMVLNAKLKSKEKDLEEENEKISKANLDKEAYQDIKFFFDDKLKEIEKNLELKFKENKNEISNLKNIIDNQNVTISNLKNEIDNLKKIVNVQNETISTQENTIQTLKEEISSLFEIKG